VVAQYFSLRKICKTVFHTHKKCRCNGERRSFSFVGSKSINSFRGFTLSREEIIFEYPKFKWWNCYRWMLQLSTSVFFSFVRRLLSLYEICIFEKKLRSSLIAEKTEFGKNLGTFSFISLFFSTISKIERALNRDLKW